ncbi:MAG: hypothetical protein ACNS62_15985 [Candidatus Cyclobacteriaceae bacterium M3_2C_046]
MNKDKLNCKKYIISKGRKLPISRCLISDGYEEKSHTLCLIIRQQPGGKFTFAFFLVDRFCLGVKDCFCNCNADEEMLQQLIDSMTENSAVVETDPVYFHNMIYAAVDYATENGFKPEKNFSLAEMVLEPDFIDDGIDDIEMGENGQPLFISGPHDNVNKILTTLDLNVGKGNYNFITLE